MGKSDSYIISGSLKKKKRRLVILNVALSTVLVLSTLCTVFLGTVWFAMGDMRQADLPENYSDLGIDIENTPMREEIRNIALFGVDSRNSKSTKGLSDTIIILSVNTKEKTIKMVSILRDSYVPITGHGTRKINAAYSLGGPVLAINTINKNFRTDITDYVTVNFTMVADIVDEVGGIDLEITEKERKQINSLLATQDFKTAYKAKPVAKAGMVHLNGPQALMYARIRKIDSDAVRSERQIKVLNLLLEKAKQMNVTQYPSLIKTMMQHVETSLSYSEILSYAPLLSGVGPIESTYVPDATKDRNVKGGKYSGANGAWVWRYDIGEAAERIHAFLYSDNTQEPNNSGISSSGGID